MSDKPKAKVSRRNNKKECKASFALEEDGDLPTK